MVRGLSHALIYIIKYRHIFYTYHRHHLYCGLADSVDGIDDTTNVVIPVHLCNV